jgi:hypothetical protein
MGKTIVQYTYILYKIDYTVLIRHTIKDPPAKAAPIRNEKGVISQSFWYL